MFYCLISAHQAIGDEKLFQKPKALLIIVIDGLENFDYDGHAFNFTDKFQPNQIQEHFKQQFGDDMIHAEVNSSGIFGSSLFKRNTEGNHANYDTYKEDLQNMYRLSDAIMEKDRKNANVVDYYRVHLDVSNARTDMERKQLAENIKRGIDTLQDAIKNSYGGNVVAEIYTHEKPDRDEKARIKLLQKVLQVTQARYIDYPASAAIMMFVGFSLVFVSPMLIHSF